MILERNEAESMATKQAGGGRSAARKAGDTAAPQATAGGRGRRHGPSTAVSPEPPPTVAAKAAGRRIRGAAELSESLDVRRRLRRLARQIERGPKHVQRMNFIEAAISDCLEDAASIGTGSDRWLSCEAATWGLAWMARTRRAGGSAGGILERLVRAAHSAQPALDAGDTSSARFLVTLARLFRDIEACRCLERPAATALSAEISRLVSAEGSVSLHGSSAVVGRVARWAAVREIASATGPAAWDEPTAAAFDRAVATALRLLGGQGRMLVGAGRMPAAFSAPVVDAAADADCKRVRRTARLMRDAPKAARAAKRRRRTLGRDMHDAAAATCIVRSGWDRDAVRVLLEYRDAVPHLEIAVGDRLLVDGPWRWRVLADGRPLDAEGPWTLSCWESDRKATFLEIVAPLAGDMQIERQIVLVPKDRVLLLADAVTRRAGRAEPANGQPHGAGGGLVVETVVPLAASLEGEQAEETRDVLVYDTRPRFLALPLSLPEWKSAGRGGFSVTPGGLALEQSTAGSRCHAPLWLDLDPRRQGRPLTWRQLTVADTRQNLPPHQATGYRVQVGREQWLVYRALDVARNRTLLGCNVSCEFLVGRIGRSGVVDRLIEIQ
jgi:hypothetical protein